MHEPFQQRTFKPVDQGDWQCDLQNEYNIRLCRAGIRALLGHRLDKTREHVLSIYIKRPRTAVREVEIVAYSQYRMKWKVKNQGKFKDVPFGTAEFLREKFPSIRAIWKRQEKTFFIRAKAGKKL